MPMCQSIFLSSKDSSFPLTTLSAFVFLEIVHEYNIIISLLFSTAFLFLLLSGFLLAYFSLQVYPSSNKILKRSSYDISFFI